MTTQFSVPEIVCDGCAASIKKALGKLEGITEVDVDVDAKRVRVDHDDRAPREAIVAALDRAGFSAA